MAKHLKRAESRKSHSWWWDSHISPKNSKWLAENLDQMDQSVKRMLKLIEEDGDSLAKKAQMYYQKRPDLILLVEEFYRMYRSLAERYDHLTGELRKNISSDLQSQTSSISEGAASELTSASGSPPLGLAAGSSSLHVYRKEADESSSFSGSETSESELDDSSIRNHNDDLLAKVAAYEKELQIANEKMQLSQVEITRLMLEVQKYKSLEGAVSVSSERKIMTKIQEASDVVSPMHQEPGLHDHDSIDTMESRSEEQVNNGDHLLLNEGSESCKLQERIDSLLVVLSEQECKIRELEMALSDSERKDLAEKAMFEAEITKYLQERTGLKGQLSEYKSRCESLIGENTIIRLGKTDCESKIKQLKEEIHRLEGSLETLKSEKGRLQKEIDAVRVELSYRDAQVEKLEGHLHQLHMEHAILIANAEKANEVVAELEWTRKELEDEIERKKKVIVDCWEEKREAIRQLCFSMEHYRSSYRRLRQAVGTGNRLAMVVAI